MSTVSALNTSNSYSDSYAANAAYHDVNQLQKINQLGQADRSAALGEVSKQFESILVNMMLKKMRSATSVLAEGNFLSSDKVNFYQEMLDDQLSIELTKDRGLGFADTLARQLGGDTQASMASASIAAPIEQALLNARMRVPVNAGYGFGEGNDSTAYQPALAALQPAANDTPVNGSFVNAGFDLAQGDAKLRFNSPQDFIRSLYPHAQSAAQSLGVKPEALLAQAALETGWGQHIPANAQGAPSFNLFGIKADQRWQGDTAQVNTLEYIAGQPVRVSAAFRSYHSFQQSFDDYVSFVRDQSRYEKAVENADDARLYFQELHKAGYATDPRYADKIMQILGRDDFQQQQLPAVELQATGS